MKLHLRVLLSILLLPAFVIAESNNTRDGVLNSIEDFAKDHRIQAVYALSENGKIIVAGAQGFHDIEQNKRLHTAQVMPIVSITKQFTAAGILLLQDRGLLSVSDTVAKHLPLSSGAWGNAKRLPKWASEISIHHLLSHSSGLAEYIWYAKVHDSQTHLDATTSIFNFAASKNPEFEPGARHEYNNTGYVILGVIIEQVSKQKLHDFFEHEFFKPLQMTHTQFLSFGDAIQLQKGLLSAKYPVRYYITPSQSTLKFRQVPADVTAAPHGDGGLISNAEDLIKWNEALHNGKVLSASAYQQMIHPYFKATDRQTGYPMHAGYGIFISKLHNGKTYFHHTGSAFGARCDAGYIPQKNISIAIISNAMVYIPEKMNGKIDLRRPENQMDISYFRDALLESL